MQNAPMSANPCLLYDTSNYCSQLSLCPSSVWSHFQQIHAEFAKQMKDKQMPDKSVKEGTKVLKHVFLNVLCCTKNVSLAFHHCQRAAYLFIEFMEQIVTKLLPMGHKEAILFVYKNTLFDLNTEYRNHVLSLDTEEVKLMDLVRSKLEQT